MSKKITAKELRRIFLQDSLPVIEEIRARTLGLKSPHPTADHDFLLKHFDAIIPIIRSVGDLEALRVQTTADVLRLIEEGKITKEEAKDYMELLKNKQNIDELPKLFEAIQGADANKTS